MNCVVYARCNGENLRVVLHKLGDGSYFAVIIYNDGREVPHGFVRFSNDVPSVGEIENLLRSICHGEPSFMLECS